MNFYNYMLIIQQEVLKAYVKKGINNVPYQLNNATGNVLLGDSAGQSAFCIPKSLFMLDTNKLREFESLAGMFDAVFISGHSISVTDEILQTGKSTQLRKLYDPENNIEIRINNKFLGYFKGIKGIGYNYFEYKGSKMICAYNSSTFEVLGVTCRQRTY